MLVYKKADIKQRDSQLYRQQVSLALGLLGRRSNIAISAVFSPVFPSLGQKLPCFSNNINRPKEFFEPIYKVKSSVVNVGEVL
jgi:hypothetical protein